MRRRLAALGAVAAISACARSDAPFAPGSHLPFGVWGGDNVEIVATDSATRVRVSCDDGQFEGNITLDTNGRFTANGNWTTDFMAFFYFPQSIPAQVSGRVTGTTLTFAIAAGDSAGTRVISTGPRTAVLGATPAFGACGV